MAIDNLAVYHSINQKSVQSQILDQFSIVMIMWVPKVLTTT